MSALKPQAEGAGITPTYAEIRWPILSLPEPHPVFGMPKETGPLIQAWYSALQGAINTHNQAMATQIESLNKQLKTVMK